MKALIWSSLFFVLTVLTFPTASDAFSRRSHPSEVSQSQAVTKPLNTSTTENGNVSAQAVPEPPALLFMTVGVGLFGIAYAVRRVQKAL
jgi:hypothetical protein